MIGILLNTEAMHGESFADRLSFLRRAEGLSQEQLDAACGWAGLRRVGNYERGSPPILDDVLAISRALGVTAGVLVDPEAFRSVTSAWQHTLPGQPELAKPLSGAISERDWQHALKRYSIIKPLIEDPFRTRAKAEAVAAAAGVHFATIYAWMGLFLDSGEISSLAPRRRGRPRGTPRLPAETEQIITATIAEMLNGQTRQSDVIAKVLNRCKIARIRAPHPNTIRARIRARVPSPPAKKRAYQRRK